VADTAPEDLPALVGKLAEAQAVAMARLTAPPPASTADAPEANLDAEEAARRLGMSTDWLYRQKSLPFRVHIGRRVLYSASGLERWNRARAGKA
jgi:predicted DNA-binding transcriptional regulator AlpA